MKSVSSEYRVGGPATARSAWLDTFIPFVVSGQIPIDFISTHAYGTDSVFDELRQKDSRPARQRLHPRERGPRPRPHRRQPAQGSRTPLHRVEFLFQPEGPAPRHLPERRLRAPRPPPHRGRRQHEPLDLHRHLRRARPAVRPLSRRLSACSISRASANPPSTPTNSCVPSVRPNSKTPTAIPTFAATTPATSRSSSGILRPSPTRPTPTPFLATVTIPRIAARPRSPSKTSLPATTGSPSTAPATAKMIPSTPFAPWVLPKTSPASRRAG